VNRSSSWLMLRRISLTPTLMLALAVLKKGLPRIRGILVSASMSRTMKSTGTKKSRTLNRMSSAIPAGVADRLIR
jgi:hypothetical protein